MNRSRLIHRKGAEVITEVTEKTSGDLRMNSLAVLREASCVSALS